MLNKKNNQWQFFPYFGIQLSLLLSIIICLPSHSFGKKESLGINRTGLGYNQLQSAVVNYADRFMAIVAQAAFDFERELPTPEARLMASRRKVYTLSAAVSIASGPDPAVALLDMMVLTTLNRMIWEEYYRPKVFGKKAKIMVQAFKTVEKDIYSIAGKVLTLQQIKELRELISDWRTNNPDQYAVDFIRFSDFGGLGQKPELKKIKSSGGLLAPVKRVAEVADEFRLMSERAMFLLNKMQLIMGLQVELIYKEIVMQPEITGLLNDVTDFKDQMEKLPKQISNERKETLKDISNLLSNERKEVLKAFDDRESTLRLIFADTQSAINRANQLLIEIQPVMSSAEGVLEKTEKTGRVLNDLVGSLDKLAVRLESGNIDVNDYVLALEKLNQTLITANSIMDTADQKGVPLLDQAIKKIDFNMKRRMYYAFWLMMILISFAGTMGISIIIVHHRLRRADQSAQSEQ